MRNTGSNPKSGFSLVEVMVATLVLAILAIGGAAVLSHAGGGIQQQQNRREALVAADTILEGYWNRSFDDLKNNYADSTFTTNATVNGKSMDVTISVGPESTDADGSSYVDLSVSINHDAGYPSDTYITRRYEFGLSRAAL